MFKVWEDIWYAADFERKDVFVYVKVYQIEALEELEGHHTYIGNYGSTEDLTKAKIMIDGFVKWDHCSNFNFTGGNYPFHFCGKEEASRLGILMEKLYDEAKIILKDCWDRVN